MRKKANPMDVTRTIVSVLGLEDKETNLLNNLDVLFEDYSPVTSLILGDLW